MKTIHFLFYFANLQKQKKYIASFFLISDILWIYTEAKKYIASFFLISNSSLILTSPPFHRIHHLLKAFVHDGFKTVAICIRN